MSVQYFHIPDLMIFILFSLFHIPFYPKNCQVKSGLRQISSILDWITMCSATKGACSDNIGIYWTDEEVIMLLVRMAKGPPYPNDVIEDVIPYQFKPSNLPENCWFYIRSNQNKDSEHGIWKTKGEPSQIYSKAAITGLRTTLEFYEGLPPRAQKTNWVMQEYSTTQKELQSNNNIKGPNILCRVFITSGTIQNKKLQENLDCAENACTSLSRSIPSIRPERSLGLNDTQERGKVENTGPLRASEEVENFFENDYLELNDLLDPGSSSFSSDDTSCVTLSSNECFDSLALLKDLEDEINKTEEGKRVNFKYNVAASAKPDEVVIPAVTLGSLTGSSDERQSPNDKSARDKSIPQNAIATHNVKHGDRKRSTSNSDNDVSSSSSHRSVLHGEKKNSGRRLKKLNRKYLCFMPF